MEIFLQNLTSTMPVTSCCTLVCMGDNWTEIVTALACSDGWMRGSGYWFCQYGHIKKNFRLYYEYLKRMFENFCSVFPTSILLFLFLFCIFLLHKKVVLHNQLCLKYCINVNFFITNFSLTYDIWYEIQERKGILNLLHIFV